MPATGCTTTETETALCTTTETETAFKILNFKLKVPTAIATIGDKIN